jgi:hypothetical protein
MLQGSSDLYSCSFSKGLPNASVPAIERVGHSHIKLKAVSSSSLHAKQSGLSEREWPIITEIKFRRVARLSLNRYFLTLIFGPTSHSFDCRQFFFFFFKKSNQSDTYGCYTDPEESFLGGLPWFDARLSNNQCSIKVHSTNWKLNADG